MNIVQVEIFARMFLYLNVQQQSEAETDIPQDNIDNILSY